MFQKHDTDKPKWSLLPLDAVGLIVRILTFGAKKYGRDNWRAATAEDLSRYEDALFRHIAAAQRGERNDPESGLPHWAHAACNTLFLLWHRECRGAWANPVPAPTNDLEAIRANVDVCSGAALDALGGAVNVYRNGRNDAQYRTSIQYAVVKLVAQARKDAENAVRAAETRPEGSPETKRSAR